MAHQHRQRRAAVATFFVAAAFFLLIVAPLLFRGAPAAAATDDAGSIWGADYFPDVPLVSHKGKKVRFFTDLIKDKVVLINFIYTNCPDSCALETAQLREVQKILGDRVGRDVFFYSITIDPARDTPQVLDRYAKKFQVGPGWFFLTGKDADIKLLRSKLGLYGGGKEKERLEEHNLNHVIGNQGTGQWMKISPYENPYVLAAQLGSWLSNWKEPPMEMGNYSGATKFRDVPLGETLFRTRCAPCHTIGAEVVAGSRMRPIGPDLLGVTGKRERKWLNRWLKEPDKVLEERDPLAMAQLAEYNNLKMPNLRLNDIDIKAVLEFIDEEGRRMEHHHHHDEHHHHEESILQ